MKLACTAGTVSGSGGLADLVPLIIKLEATLAGRLGGRQHDAVSQLAIARQTRQTDV